MRVDHGKLGAGLIVCLCLLGVGACGGAVGESALTGDGSDTELLSPTPARGISIVEVEVNQGTRVPIGAGGEWVELGARSAELLASRDTLLRVHHVVDADWIPREIEARLRLEFPDGTTAELSDRRMVEQSSSAKDWNGPFRFSLTAAAGQTVAGTRYHIELWEVEGGLADGLAEGEWANPVEGPQAIGFEPVAMQIKTLLVPITYQDATVALSEETVAALIDNLYEQNPTTEVLYDVREPVPYEGQLTELGNLLPLLAELRVMDAAEPNVYYHALIDVGSQSIAGTFGISNLANDTEGDAGSRVSATVVWTPNPALAAETFTHETGHAQGLSHVECPNRMAAGPDPTYPHANGGIGNWGYGIIRMLTYDPDVAYDYMSYCSPTWVSDWTWAKTAARIETLTSWDFGAPGGGQPIQELLVIATYRDGTQQWWTMPGALDPARIGGSDRVMFETVGGEVIEAYADVSTLSDDRTTWARVALPTALTELREVRHLRVGEPPRVITAAELAGHAPRRRLEGVRPYAPTWTRVR